MLNSNDKNDETVRQLLTSHRPFGSNDRLFEYMKTEYPGADMFVSQRTDKCTILCIHNGHCRLVYIDEMEPNQIDEVFLMAVRAGYTSIGAEMLVDWRFFSGVVDWNYVKTRKEIAPHMKTQPKKIAYVMRDETGVLTGKAVTVWMKGCDSRIFIDRSDAESWLGWR